MGECVGVDRWIEIGVVVHLHLAIEFEAPFAAEGVLPEGIEAGGEIVALLIEQGEAAAILLVVGLRGRGAATLLGGVVDLEREDG